MHHSTHPTQLLDHEPPPRRRLQRHLELLAAEAAQELAHAHTVRRRYSPAPHLARPGIEPVSGDLRSMLVNPITIVTWGLLKLHGLNACADQRRA
jgi:hypothetical protein